MAVDPCDILIGPAKEACQSASDIASGVGSAATFASDPLGGIADGTADAAAWIISKLSSGVNSSTQVDFTNTGFLRQYAIVFGACTFLTLILWLLAVIKRVVRGESLSRSFGEAIGFLWLAVLASAFTPLILALLVSLTDTMTYAIAANTRADTERFLAGLSQALSPGESSLGGGPILLIIVSILAIIASAIIWLELLIRAAMLYVGAILGCAVYAGLVDRSLWRHVRRWAGIMVAVTLSKPVLVIVLGLAAAILGQPGSGDSFAAVLTGLAILFLAIFASVVIYRFIPSFGDDMAAVYHSRKTAAAAGPGAAFNSPTSYIRHGIATHANRGQPSTGLTPRGAAALPGAASGLAAGVASYGASRAMRAAFGGSGAGSNGSDGRANGAAAAQGQAQAGRNQAAHGHRGTAGGAAGATAGGTQAADSPATRRSVAAAASTATAAPPHTGPPARHARPLPGDEQ
ncbi:MAG TPA: hypothetical protein VKG85_02180 [Actinomycetes bacterium]|nr:hypothetical protein [Actinomycetes bacterium]